MHKQPPLGKILCEAGLCGFDSQTAGMQEYKPDCVLRDWIYRDLSLGLGKTGSLNKELSTQLLTGKTQLLRSLQAFTCSNVTFALVALSELQVSIHSKHTDKDMRLWGLAQGSNISSVVIFKKWLTLPPVT